MGGSCLAVSRLAGILIWKTSDNVFQVTADDGTEETTEIDAAVDELPSLIILVHICTPFVDADQ